MGMRGKTQTAPVPQVGDKGIRDQQVAEAVKTGAKIAAAGVSKAEDNSAQLKGNALFNGKLASFTMPAYGSSVTVTHHLGRQVKGWVVANHSGGTPEFDVTSNTATSLTILSRERIVVEGTFTTSAGGNPSGSGTYWTVGRTGVGVYTVTLSVTGATLLHGAAFTRLATADSRMFLASWANPTATFNHQTAAGLADISSSSVDFQIVVTGGGNSMQLWVF